MDLWGTFAIQTIARFQKKNQVCCKGSDFKYDYTEERVKVSSKIKPLVRREIKWEEVSDKDGEALAGGSADTEEEWVSKWASEWIEIVI
jgi:hypothetical protein